MPEDLTGKRTGERIQILRERKGLSRPVLAGLVGMSASWLKGIEQGRRLPPRLPVLVKLAEALAVGDVAVLAGTDMDIGTATTVPVASFARIPHEAVPAIREAVRDPMLTPATPVPAIDVLAARVSDAWAIWHTSRRHRADVGRILPRLVTDARAAARSGTGPQRRAASALLAGVYTLVQHEIVWASEAGYHHPWTMFGAANIALHAVSINADLTKSAAARSQAEQIDPDQIPSRERRGRLGVEIARAYHQRRDYPAMLHWLEYAHQTAADSVHYSPTARQMTAEAADHGGPLISRGARTLATSLGLPL